MGSLASCVCTLALKTLHIKHEVVGSPLLRRCGLCPAGDLPQRRRRPRQDPRGPLAEAAHFAAKGAVVPAHFGYAGAFPYAGAYAGAYNGLYNGYWNGAWNGWNGAYYNGAYNPYFAPQALVAHPNGAVVPVDEPAVAAAKADHFAAHGLPIAPTAAVYAAGYPGLVAHPNGALVPAEPADV